jgi:hypothetical protein
MLRRGAIGNGYGADATTMSFWKTTFRHQQTLGTEAELKFEGRSLRKPFAAFCRAEPDNDRRL